MDLRKEIILKAAATVLLIVWFGAAVYFGGVKQYYTVEKEEIPFKIISKKSRFIQKGWTVWLEEGVKGYRNSAKKVYKRGHKIINNKEIYQSEVLKEPEAAIAVTGISDKKHSITVPKTTYVHYKHNMEATAYDPSPESNGLNWAGITALGWRTRHGIAAVDPGTIALRSLLYIPGYGFAWAGDTGGDIKKKRIDLCYNTTAEALKWGRRKVKVYVLGKHPISYYKLKRK